MNVLLLVPSYPSPASPVDGIFLRAQAEALVQAGASVDVVGPVPHVPPRFLRFGPNWDRYAKIPLRSEVNGVRIRRPRYVEVPRGNYWAWPHEAYARSAKSVETPPDVVHAHFAYPAGLAAAAAAAHWGVPSFLTLHGSDVNIFPHVNRLTRNRFRRAVVEADVVLAVTSILASRTEALSGRTPLVRPIGIDLTRYESLPERRAAREALGVPPDARLALFVGRLTVEKGVRECLAALHRLQRENVMGLFVGDGPLLEEVRASGVAIAAGLQPGERIPRYLAAADLLVLPSYSEGLPTVLVEAGAAGTPIAATRVGGIPELLGSDGGVLFEPRSSEAVEAAIHEVLNDGSRARERARRFAAVVREEHDIRKNARSLVRLYEELIARRSGSRRAPAGAA